MPTKRKAPAKKKPTAKPSSAPAGMSATQKTIYDKLKRKGMSDKQAAAFSKHAAKRKQTTRNRMAANPKSATRKTVSKKKK